MKPFVFTVSIEVERESGKFMSRDEVQEQLREQLEGAGVDEVSGGADGESVYTVVSMNVDDA